MSERKYTNEILENHHKWLLIDISTSMFPGARMAVDKSVFMKHSGGRIFAARQPTTSYIVAQYNMNGKTHAFHKDVLDADFIDHIEHGTNTFIDNRSSNLRSVTRSQNQMNRSNQSNSASGITGVRWRADKKRYMAYICYKKKHIHLGSFKKKEDAISARRKAEEKYFGEYSFNGGKYEQRRS